MWVFFRDDGFGLEAKAFSRLLTIFALHDQRLNVAAYADLLNEDVLKESIPYSYQASPYLQIVSYVHSKPSMKNIKGDLHTVRDQFMQNRMMFEGLLENYFPCFTPGKELNREILDLLPECGFKMISCDKNIENIATSIPNFHTSLELSNHNSAKEIFQELAKWHDEGKDFSGIKLNHSEMKENDFEKLDELLKELSKRNIQTVFFSDMHRGSERRTGIEVGHV